MDGFFGDRLIPANYGICPRCGSQLSADVYECSTETGTPTETGFYVACEASKRRFWTAMGEADAKGLNDFPDDYEPECNWDYDELLRASAEAYRYLKNLNN